MSSIVDFFESLEHRKTSNELQPSYAFWLHAFKTVQKEVTKANEESQREHLGQVEKALHRKVKRLCGETIPFESESSILINRAMSLQDMFVFQPILQYLLLLYTKVYIVPLNFDFTESFDENLQFLTKEKAETTKKNATVILDEFNCKEVIAQFQLNERLLDNLKVKRALFMSHLGLGDLVCLNAAVNYLSIDYDEFYIVSLRQNYVNARMMYSETNYKVKIFDFDERRYDAQSFWTFLERTVKPFFATIYTSGYLFHPNRHYIDLPAIFYRELGLDPSLRITNTNLPRLKESAALYEVIKELPYIFVHQEASDSKQSLIHWDIQTILTLDPNRNLYSPGDSFYELGNLFAKKPYFYYIDTIENASALYLVNSSFSSIAINLPRLKAKERKIFCRYTGKELDLQHLFIAKEENNLNPQLPS